MNRLLIFGTGQFFFARKGMFKYENVIGFMDNNPNLWGNTIDGIPVYPPNRVKEICFDDICIMTGMDFVDEIRCQLISVGIDAAHIHTCREFFAKKREVDVELHVTRGYKNNDVCMLLANLNNTGGFRASLYAIKAMREKGHNITVITSCKGNGLEELTATGVDIIITPDISLENEIVMETINRAKCVFINSLSFAYFVPEVSKSKKTIWWIHSGETGYKKYEIPKELSSVKNIEIYAVSNVAKRAFERNTGYKEVRLLPVGIFDEKIKTTHNRSKETTIFAVIGAVSPVKGIDVLISAVKLLQDKTRESLQFWIIGATPNKRYYEKCKEMSDGMECIKWIGYKPHDELMTLMGDIDVVISSSREDMLPIVLMEAMMNEIPCIISDAVGTADYVDNNVNGIIFKSENPADLADRICWSLENERELQTIGKKSRELYEKEFSIPIFTKRINETVEGCINENLSSL